MIQIKDNIVEHLFREQSGRLVSVLTRIFGSHNIELAEDVVQESFAEAISHWAYNGLPDNPAAWIFTVAKNKALNVLRREKYQRQFAAESAHLLQSEWTAEPSMNYFFSDMEILDDQLRMIFTCCHPGITRDSQVVLILRTLCGFSILEIFRAFLTNDENITKRLVRARRYIRDNKITFEVPSGDELEKRLDAVLESMYLLFNEGYSSSSGKDIIRYDLCEEAIRLMRIIASHHSIKYKSDVYALLASMYFNASRFRSRQNQEGMLIDLAHQDRNLWDRKLIAKGLRSLSESITIEEKSVSKYHIMATISAHHCTAANNETTDWKSILSLYDHLVQLDDSAIVLLNRAVALSKVIGLRNGIEELEKLKHNPLLKDYPYYFSVLGELYLRSGDHSSAAAHFQTALKYTDNQAEISLLKHKIVACTTGN